MPVRVPCETAPLAGIAAPVWVTPAFDDRGAVARLVRADLRGYGVSMSDDAAVVPPGHDVAELVPSRFGFVEENGGRKISEQPVDADGITAMDGVDEVGEHRHSTRVMAVGDRLYMISAQVGLGEPVPDGYATLLASFTVF